MQVECWGHNIEVEEPNIVGTCHVCGEDIYDYQKDICEYCQWLKHKECKCCE